MPTGHCESFYRYEVTIEGEKWRFRERKEIVEKFGISLSSVRHIMKGLHQYRQKWKDVEIIKIKVPIRPSI